VINSRPGLSAPAGYRFPREVIAVAVRWYLRYGLSVQAQVTCYHPCPTCAGTGYQPIPPDYDRHWPPTCPSCHRLRVLPDVTVEIGATHLLLTHPTAESRSPAACGPNTQTAG
jgi:hypothetical protein